MKRQHMANLWWGGRRGQKKTRIGCHGIDYARKRRGEGWVLEIRHIFNLALQAKQGWRLLLNEDTEDAALVHAIPLSSSDVEDSWIWHYSSQGMHTVSLGYETALMLKRLGQNSGGGGGQLSKREADKKV
ncbi:hypothetical protein RHMOL_Rhmol07G0218400 [Rhododendron molle]|uniref:Uncharacterized protein n=1 Tax=Rhododendron molle TaxID=49168 RepID=A0ACC0N390_RHOML|nr:hypothetical protein RHMOL_Rhmol07G0218400 [Rhododendron molle]